MQIAAGNGVFLKCHNSKYVLPGTLLGFFPGIIYDKSCLPKESGEKEYSSLRRYDNFCIEYQNVTLPFPVKPGLCTL